MLNAKVELDKRAFDQLEAALQMLPLEYRQKFLLQVQKTALQPVVKHAANYARAKTQSPTIAKSIHVVKGKYVKQTGGAYSVVEHRNKLYNRTRKLGKFTLPHKTNYSKIERFLINGTKGGIRTAGMRTRKRAESKGGGLYTTTGNKSARGFVVQGRNGQYMKVKKVNMTRFPGHFYYDVAFREKMASAEAKFAAEVFSKFDDFVAKNHLK